MRNTTALYPTAYCSLSHCLLLFIPLPTGLCPTVTPPLSTSAPDISLFHRPTCLRPLLPTTQLSRLPHYLRCAAIPLLTLQNYPAASVPLPQSLSIRIDPIISCEKLSHLPHWASQHLCTTFPQTLSHWPTVSNVPTPHAYPAKIPQYHLSLFHTFCIVSLSNRLID
jgi:hypothetical protein